MKKPTSLEKNRNSKVVKTQEFDMKVLCATTQTRLESQGDGFFCKPEEKSSESDKKKKRAIWGREGVVYQ
jgi:hypothetical protein